MMTCPNYDDYLFQSWWLLAHWRLPGWGLERHMRSRRSHLLPDQFTIIIKIIKNYHYNGFQKGWSDEKMSATSPPHVRISPSPVSRTTLSDLGVFRCSSTSCTDHCHSLTDRLKLDIIPFSGWHRSLIMKMTNLPVLLVPSYQGRVGKTHESSRSSAEDLG